MSIKKHILKLHLNSIDVVIYVNCIEVNSTPYYFVKLLLSTSFHYCEYLQNDYQHNNK